MIAAPWRAVRRWLVPRSGGVRVRRGTLPLIRAGDAARSDGNWQAAALAYRRALEREPGLAHLWVQLGHMEKEACRPGEAAAAYHQAARWRPADPEPFLHLGHMAKAGGKPDEAAAYFVVALQRNPDEMEAVAELVRLLPDRDEVDPALWSAAVAALGIDPAEQADVDAALPVGATMLDVTDLLAFFGGRRLPTGIQRVQIEVSLACLADMTAVPPVFCVYASARRGWVRLPPALFEAVCRLAKQGDDARDPAWVVALDRLYRRIAIARTVRFPAGAALVNLGTSWSDRNYLLDVRNARVIHGLRYVPLIFDLIPFVGPHWFTGPLVRDYRAWFGSLVHSADLCLTISDATRGDLSQVAAANGAPMPAGAAATVRLDGDFRQKAEPAASLAARGLAPGGFVLLVSTLEPRKNHLGAFRAWLLLLDALGEAAVPRLVCVGGRGWLNDALHRMLRERPALRRHVLLLHGVPDDELATLYQQCLFVLYPSFYEGWGLPVSEALSWGKVPAISRTSSMPEAGGAFARYFDPHDPADIAATVGGLLDGEERVMAEAAIRRDYRPRAWHDIAQDILGRAAEAPSRQAETLPRLDGIGRWSLAVPSPGDDAGVHGEALRHGRSWQMPDMDGCAIRGEDAELRFGWAGMIGAALCIRFAVTDAVGAVEVAVDGRRRTVILNPGEPATFALPLPATAADLRITLLPVTGKVAVESVSIDVDRCAS